MVSESGQSVQTKLGKCRILGSQCIIYMSSLEHALISVAPDDVMLTLVATIRYTADAVREVDWNGVERGIDGGAQNMTMTRKARQSRENDITSALTRLKRLASVAPFVSLFPLPPHSPCAPLSF